MMSTPSNYILFLSLTLFLNHRSLEYIPDQDPVTHTILMDHPAFEGSGPYEYILVEHQDDNGYPSAYHLEVESVICANHICKKVSVRLYWGPLGNYIRYELNEGVILEKKQGEPFLSEDYDRLHVILSDKASPYKDLTYHEVTHEKVFGEGQVDGISSATSVILNKNKTILGAAWTCYTLWHWANGEIVQELQKITGAGLSVKHLSDHIKSQNEVEQIFALNELIRRGDYDSRLVQSVITIASNANKEINKLTIKYLERSPTSDYFESMMLLLESENAQNRILYLRSLLRADYEASEEIYDLLVKKLLGSKSYQEIDLILTLLSKKNYDSTERIDQVMYLLERSIIIARRAYWFLKKQKLTETQRKRLEEFYHKNQSRL